MYLLSRFWREMFCSLSLVCGSGWIYPWLCENNTMSSGSVNMTGVNSSVFTQVFYFESILQKHVCLSLVFDAGLNITGLVLVLICRLEDEVCCCSSWLWPLGGSKHSTSTSTQPASYWLLQNKSSSKGNKSTVWFVSKHSCQQFFNFICRWVYVLMQRLLCCLPNIHTWMNERMNEWMSLLKPLDSISNQYKYK